MIANYGIGIFKKCNIAAIRQYTSHLVFTRLLLEWEPKIVT